MSIKRFFRGDSTLNVGEIEVFLEDYYDFDSVDLKPIEGENWLSVPFVLNDTYFVKVITSQNLFTHSFFTRLRNLGVTVSGSKPFFETFDSPMEMAEHEFEAARRISEFGVRTPEPVEVIEVDGKALLVFEYLDDFEPLSRSEYYDDELMTNVFGSLRKLHDNGFAHGDFSLENVLIVDGETYFIDSTKIKDDGWGDAVAYDLACALGSLAPRTGEERAVEVASEFYDEKELKHALDFLVVARLRPGIEERFSVLRLRKAIV